MEIIIGLLLLAAVGYFVFFRKKKDETVYAPYKIDVPSAAPAPAPAPEEVQPVTEAKVDPVSVALDLEPLDLSATAEPAKKPRKPRAPKAETTKKPAAKKDAPKKAAAPKAKKSKKS